MSPTENEDFAAMINAAAADGWIAANGLKLLTARPGEVTAELPIQKMHLQAYGIVHGGIHAAIIETLASIGAALDAMPAGKSVVGLENHTSFLRAVRGGVLRAVAKPVLRGRRTHVWEGTVSDEQGKVAATGRVRLLILEAGAEVAGEKAELKRGPEGP